MRREEQSGTADGVGRAHGSRTVYAYVLILPVYAYDKLNLRLSTGRRRTDRKDRISYIANFTII